MGSYCLRNIDEANFMEDFQRPTIHFGVTAVSLTIFYLITMAEQYKLPRNASHEGQLIDENIP
jgi:hypothetical protein